MTETTVVASALGAVPTLLLAFAFAVRRSHPGAALVSCVFAVIASVFIGQYALGNLLN